MNPFRLAFVLGLAAVALGASAQNLVVDGDFESAALGYSSGNPTFLAGTSFDGGAWTVGGVRVDIDIRNSYTLAGDRSLFLNPANGSGSVTQTIPTSTGTLYTVSFIAQSNAQNALTVLFGGNTLLSGAQVPIKTFGETPTLYTFNVQATSSASLLSFGGSGTATLSVDNISVIAATPEPSALAALGLGAVAVLRRRKRA